MSTGMRGHFDPALFAIFQELCENNPDFTTAGSDSFPSLKPAEPRKLSRVA